MKKFLIWAITLFPLTLPVTAQAQTPGPSAVSAEAPIVAPSATTSDWGVFSNHFWVKVYDVGTDYSMLGDVINGIKAWNNVEKSYGLNPSSSTHNIGSGWGAELGYSLDSANAFSLSAESSYFPSETEGYTNAGTSTTESLEPSVQSISLNYYRTIFLSRAARTSVFIGGGYYHASMNYSTWTYYPIPPTGMTATFTGDTLGETLGANEEINLGHDITLGISVKGRLATFSQVTSFSIADMGSTLPGSAPYLLAINTQSGQYAGTIAAIAHSSLQDGWRYAVVDFSGISGGFSFAYHF